jgi:chemotaxis signal transduction protein
MSEVQEKKILILDVAGSFFALSLEHVEECVPATSITPISGLPNYVLGLASVRGKILTVVDPAIRFELGMGLRRYFLVCNVRGRSMAVAIDQPVAAGVLRYDILGEEKINDFANKEFRQAILHILQPAISEQTAKEEVRINFTDQVVELNPDEFVANRDFIATAAG